MREAEPGHVILFDGVCNLCNAWVRFIIRRDRQALFKFAPLQSGAGRDLCRRAGFDPDAVQTVMLVSGNRARIRSDAVLEIARLLGRPWNWLGVLRLFPRSLRDGLYSFIARHRYRWFGSSGQCLLPAPELRDRFLA